MPARPPTPTANPLRLMLEDFRADRAAEVPFPPGELSFSLARTQRYMNDPLGDAARRLRSATGRYSR